MAEQNTQQATGNAMPCYVSQKPVWALQIARSEHMPVEGVYLLHAVDDTIPPFKVSEEWMAKHHPQEGWYLVTYEGGYTSCSPKEAFEAGCTLLDQYGPPESQEPKYTVGPRGRLFNRHTDQPIPDDEPVFVLRAKDRHATNALRAYLTSLPSGLQYDAVEQRLQAFTVFKQSHPERVREPD